MTKAWTPPAASTTATVLYFASVREGVGKGQEIVDLPGEVATVGDFLAWLRARGPEYEAALGEALAIRTAVDRVHADAETSVRGAREIAVFPMMTGG
jgi:molybdopterin synthase sulfur carrier subunit